MKNASNGKYMGKYEKCFSNFILSLKKLPFKTNVIMNGRAFNRFEGRCMKTVTYMSAWYIFILGCFHLGWVQFSVFIYYFFFVYFFNE